MIKNKKIARKIEKKARLKVTHILIDALCILLVCDKYYDLACELRQKLEGG